VSCDPRHHPQRLLWLQAIGKYLSMTLEFVLTSLFHQSHSITTEHPPQPIFNPHPPLPDWRCHLCLALPTCKGSKDRQ